MELISIKDKLPPEDKMCLCCCKDEPLVKWVVASYVKSVDCFIDYYEYGYNVTHWCELPKI